ncbi:MAG: hypothetical protein K2K29_01005, partial [Muribaculaceae bacterium]|nr:hypothetical protein [Muribaculaceae bacterium]
MDNLNQPLGFQEEDSTFSLKDFFISCLAKWNWFFLSIFFCVALGAAYVIRQQPVYERTMQVLVQDSEGGGISDITNAFKSFGLGGGNSNVYNELVSLKSPAVMQEVVNRLNLTVSQKIRKLPHNVTVYGTSAPSDIHRESAPGFPSASFRMDLNP